MVTWWGLAPSLDDCSYQVGGFITGKQVEQDQVPSPGLHLAGISSLLGLDRGVGSGRRPGQTTADGGRGPRVNGSAFLR